MNDLEERVLAMMTTNAQMELSRKTTAKCAVKMILDEAITEVEIAYNMLGDIYTSRDMYDGAIEAIEALKDE